MTRTGLVVLLVGGLNLANGVIAAERYPFPTLERAEDALRKGFRRLFGN
jgi:hypothetical protein